MTKNRRYEAFYDRLSDARLANVEPPPCAVPPGAWGPQRVEWRRQGRPLVWAWITWPHRPMERVAAVATGWNDRVVCVEWDSDRGTRNTMVWRSAVTRRRDSA